MPWAWKRSSSRKGGCRPPGTRRKEAWGRGEGGEGRRAEAGGEVRGARRARGRLAVGREGAGGRNRLPSASGGGRPGRTERARGMPREGGGGKSAGKKKGGDAGRATSTDVSFGRGAAELAENTRKNRERYMDVRKIGGLLGLLAGVEAVRPEEAEGAVLPDFPAKFLKAVSKEKQMKIPAGTFEDEIFAQVQKQYPEAKNSVYALTHPAYSRAEKQGWSAERTLDALTDF